MSQLDGWSQHEQRVSTANRSGRLFVDQHGRTWHAEVEKKTNDACSPYRLHKPRSAPIVPDSNFIRNANGIESDTRLPYDIFIDYKAWLVMVEEGWRMHAQFKANIANQNPKLTGDEVNVIAGKPKLPPRVIQQLMAGNEYLLGLRPFDPANAQDVWLKRHVDPDPIDSMSWGDDFPVDVVADTADPFEDDAGSENRPEQIRALRAAGKTWKEVAAIMGLSENRCMQLAKVEPAPV